MDEIKKEDEGQIVKKKDVRQEVLTQEIHFLKNN